MKRDKKYALCVIKNNRLLVKLEKGAERLILPGGKAKGDEGAIQALCREIREELGVEIDIASLKFLGKFEGPAGERENQLLQVELYAGDYFGQMKLSPEVEKLVWFARDDDWNQLAPVVRDEIMPELIEKGILT